MNQELKRRKAQTAWLRSLAKKIRAKGAKIESGYKIQHKDAAEAAQLYRRIANIIVARSSEFHYKAIRKTAPKKKNKDFFDFGVIKVPVSETAQSYDGKIDRNRCMAGPPEREEPKHTGWGS